MDKLKAKKNLEEILKKIHTDTDVLKLREYQKIYKKEISLFKRSWAAAWLLMYYDDREIPPAAAPDKKKPVFARNIEKTGSAAIKTPAAEKPVKNAKQKTQSEKPPVEILMTEEESKKLFFSIGKNRKLFPREVITLIMTKTGAAREDIGMIRILDNYSFVQVRDTKADEIIEKLTGHKFRGRTLSVNYAKPKSTDNEEEN
ncbi:MAG: DbpA RNA binding domain-containing protein [Treponema sp.]|nr:DbpA RNA binding domain-containing protein [Treponema sp.]